MDYKTTNTTLQKQGLRRSLKEVASRQHAAIVLNGHQVLNFCSNNYLGLAADPRLSEAASQAMESQGFGAGSAALIAGDMSAHAQLRDQLRKFFGVQGVLLFNSGYHANVGAIPALATAEGAIFSDELNHASIIDGCRLARCPVHIYRHGDPTHLEELLRRHPCNGRRWIITESIFSMDGDRAPLTELAEVALQYDAGLYLDEAHAMGVIGPEGRGLWEDVGANLVFAQKRGQTIGGRTQGSPLLVRMGTFGKAFGSYGAFVVADTALTDYLLNKARTFIYTTALPPAVAAASTEALAIAQAEPERRKKLWQHIRLVAEELGVPATSPIIPWQIPGNREVLEASERLLEQGYYVQAIRAPTVPAGTERLRITLSAMHTEEEVAGLVEALKRL